LQADPNLFHLLEARQLIEIEVAAQAATRRRVQDLLPVHDALAAMAAVPAGKRPDYVEHDIRFHLAIAEVAGNTVLAVTLKAILGLLRPFLCQLPFDAACRDRTQKSHEAIYRALVAGDADAARSQLREHMRFAYDNLLGQVQTVPGTRPASR
jgi:DNA-binding FadR family transcriptional regulator